MRDPAESRRPRSGFDAGPAAAPAQRVEVSQQASNARAKSAMRSSVASNPTDRRIKPVTDSRALSLLSRHPRMRRRGRPRNQALDPAEAGRADWNRQAVDERLGRCESAAQLEAHHAAETIEQFARALIAGVVFEAWIIHRRNFRVTGEIPSNLGRTRVLMTYAHPQRL